jgi:hypothetical protein
MNWENVSYYTRKDYPRTYDQASLLNVASKFGVLGQETVA